MRWTKKASGLAADGDAQIRPWASSNAGHAGQPAAAMGVPARRNRTAGREPWRGLADKLRYSAAVGRPHSRWQGVGLLTALVFLTEMGDLARFANRRQISAVWAWCRGATRAGRRSDRKGHITRQGSSRVRRDVVSGRVGQSPPRTASDHAAYRRLVERNPKHKKVTDRGGHAAAGRENVASKLDSGATGEATPWGEVRRADAPAPVYVRAYTAATARLAQLVFTAEMVFMDKELELLVLVRERDCLCPGLTARRRV